MRYMYGVRAWELEPDILRISEFAIYIYVYIFNFAVFNAKLVVIHAI